MKWLKYIERGKSWGRERLPRKHLPFQYQLRHDCVFDSAATSWQRCGLAECLHFVDFVSFSLSPCVCLFVCVCVFSGVSMILNASMFCLSVCLFALQLRRPVIMPFPHTCQFPFPFACTNSSTTACIYTNECLLE